MVHLYILEDGRVCFENGKPLDFAQLREEVRILKHEDPRPNISLEPKKTAPYETIKTVFTIFQDESYGPYLGFTGLDKPE